MQGRCGINMGVGKMANYVRNYVFCNDEVYRDFLYEEFDKRLFQEGAYDLNGYVLNDHDRLLIFETHGMEYYSDWIEPIIERYHDIIWNCVEENDIEEGCFKWDGHKVSLSLRELTQEAEDSYFSLCFSDQEFRTLKKIIIFPEKIVEENFVINTRREFLLSEVASFHIKEFLRKKQKEICSIDQYGMPLPEEEEVWDEYGFFNDDLDHCFIEHFTHDDYTEETYEPGKRISKEVREGLHGFFSDNMIDIKIDYDHVMEFALENVISSYNDSIITINRIAEECLDAISGQKMVELKKDLGLISEYGELGFVSDSGESFISEYSEEAFKASRSLISIIDSIDNIKILGSAIYSKWCDIRTKYDTHWLDEDERRWFELALERLVLLTVPYAFPTCKIEGPLERVYLTTNVLHDSSDPAADDEVAQNILILSDGRIWFTKFKYGETGFPYQISSKERELKVSKKTIRKLLSAFKKFCNSGEYSKADTDNGTWQIFIRGDGGNEFRLSGGIGGDAASELSDLLRTVMNRSDLMALDGENGKPVPIAANDTEDDYFVTVCSIQFPGSLTYYHYIADTEEYKEHDKVIVPTGEYNTETVGEIYYIDYYEIDDVPYPLDKLKHIIRKA